MLHPLQWISTIIHINVFRNSKKKALGSGGRAEPTRGLCRRGGEGLSARRVQVLRGSGRVRAGPGRRGPTARRLGVRERARQGHSRRGAGGVLSDQRVVQEHGQGHGE